MSVREGGRNTHLHKYRKIRNPRRYQDKLVKSSIWEAEARGMWVQASLSYILRSYIKKKKKKDQTTAVWSPTRIAALQILRPLHNCFVLRILWK